MMTDEQWARFAARVPVGTQIRFHRSDEVGILLENKPGIAIDRAVRMYQCHIPEKMFRVAVQYFKYTNTPILDPRDLQYTVDQQWLTFDEVMALEVSA